MNKEKYTEVFSEIYPSDKCIERILSMTAKKKNKILVKTILAVAAAMSLILISFITANALTDGKVADTAKTVFDKITSFPVSVTEDGKPVEENEYVTEICDENGKHILKVNTKNGEVICETPYEEYEKNGLGDSYTIEEYVDENGVTHKEIVHIGNGDN